MSISGRKLVNSLQIALYSWATLDHSTWHYMGGSIDPCGNVFATDLHGTSDILIQHVTHFNGRTTDTGRMWNELKRPKLNQVNSF